MTTIYLAIRGFLGFVGRVDPDAAHPRARFDGVHQVAVAGERDVAGHLTRGDLDRVTILMAVVVVVVVFLNSCNGLAPSVAFFFVLWSFTVLTRCGSASSLSIVE
jgi:hypothetical protein